MINADTLWEYPVSTNTDLYTSFGSRATNIVLNGVHEFDLEALLPFFKIAYQMTFVDVKDQTWKQDELTFPSTMRMFSLIRCTSLILRLGDNGIPLESLYLEEDYDNLFLTVAPKIATVTSLTAINVEIYLITSTFPNLRSLTLRVWRRHRTYDHLKGLDKLEHLRILQCVDWTEQEVIDTLPIKSVEVSYTQRPTEENTILRLNDDCLYHVQRFLCPRDWILLKLAHSGWEHLRCPLYHVDIKHKDLSSDSQLESLFGFYSVLGPYVSSLEICPTIKPDLFREVLSMFPNLKALAVTFDARTLASIPNGLERLAFKAELDDDLSRTPELFRRLNATLKSLHIKYLPEDGDDFGTVQGLSELTNVQEYHGRYLYYTKDVLRFLQLSYENLTSLELRLTEDMEFWQLLSQMKNIKHLHLDCNYKRIPAGVFQIALPGLEELSVSNLPEEGVSQFLLQLDGVKLRSFEYSGLISMLTESVWRKMPNLVKLVLVIQNNDMEMEEVEYGQLRPGIFLLSKLQSLSVDIDENDVLQLVKGLPELTRLDGMSIESRDTIVRIREYLRGSKRKLCLCGNIL